MPRRAVIAGIGEAPLSPAGSGRSAEGLTLDAAIAACHDAGIPTSDVDAVVKYSYDASISAMGLAVTLGCREMRFALDVPHGGGSSAALIDVARALVTSGQARTVLCFRTIVGTDWLGQLASADPARPYYLDAVNYLRPVGWSGYLHLFAALYQEHAARTGLTRETLFHSANLLRHNASHNATAVATTPISREEYFSAPLTVGPFTAFDEYAVADTSSAVVVTADERSAPGRPRVEILASVQSHGPDPKAWFDLRSLSDSYPDSPATQAASALYQESGLTPGHINVALLYDCTSFTPLELLTQYGLCDPVDLPDLVAGGELRSGGQMPMNPNGGDFAGGYSHGFRHVVEAVHQLRGTADNQVPDAEFCLVAAPHIGPTSAAILHRAE